MSETAKKLEIILEKLESNKDDKNLKRKIKLFEEALRLQKNLIKEHKEENLNYRLKIIELLKVQHINGMPGDKPLAVCAWQLDDE